MIEASVRFNRGWLGQVFFGDLQLTEDGRELHRAELHQKASGKKVLILVHGYHTSFPDAQDSFLLIEDELAKRGLNYDLTIGFFWPGSPVTAGFLPSIGRAAKAGRLLTDLIYWLSDVPQAIIDIETHSLGAEVALTALSATHARVRTLFLTGPAVEANCFQPKKRFESAAAHCDSVEVFYSRRDEVLGVAMPFGELWVVDEGGALGFRGPAVPFASHVTPFDLTSEVSDHGGYKRAPSLYAEWEKRCA